MFLTALWGLALSALLSATILPGSSEAALVLMLKNYPDEWWLIGLVASVFNTLGSLISYGMGRCFPANKRPSEKAMQLLHRWGVWLLLFSWVPVVGDALPLAAGWLRLNVGMSALMIMIGKTLRYAVILAALLPFWR